MKHGVRCLGANMVPIRRGVYSCELVKSLSPESEPDLKEARGGIFIKTKGKYCKSAETTEASIATGFAPAAFELPVALRPTLSESIVSLTTMALSNPQMNS